MPKFRLVAVSLASLLIVPAVAMAQSIYVKDQEGHVAQPTLPDKTVVLTFDDGPSSYTPKILNILKEKGVKGTFFVIGNQAIKEPFLKKIYDEGHEIGNHTYGHVDLSSLPSWRVKLELNLSRIIIMSQTNHATRLFRPPYLGSDKLAPSASDIVNRAAELGYISVGETTDSKDWQKPGVQQIIQSATRDAGGVILFHDGGGDRRQTVDALPGIIDYYQEKGFKFATVSEALGLSRKDVMPSLSLIDRMLAIFALAIFTIAAWLGRSLHWLILILIIASFARFVLVTMAALIQSHRKYLMPESDLPKCSVIIPAYNESAVIQSCLKSVLASVYPDFEVLVVDDGSKDDTLVLASGITDHRLHVLHKENGGKASALNYGISKAHTPFIIAIDADTIFKAHTMTKLMRHFANPKVGAVSGNTKIVNRHKLITKLQSLEYVVGFNLDRRMGDLFDCITVVPGAVGAFRRAVINKVGGFTFDTLAEDTDLTLSIKEAGYKIVYDAKAVALTEAPATIRDLLKQRFRWTFGTMQAAWKHKKAFFNPRNGTLGMIGLPYLLFFQIIFPLFSPFFDLALVVGLLSHQYKLMAISFVVYTVVDILTAAIALKLDNEKLRTLWILMPQRVFYRQLMYYVIVRSFINVLKGKLVHWGSLERKGTHLARSA